MGQAIQKLVDYAKRMQVRQKNQNLASRQKTEQMTGAALQLVGGAAGGALDGYVGGGETHEIFGVPTALGSGIILALAGLSDIVPGAEYIASFGLGAASYGLGNLVRDKLTPA